MAAERKIVGYCLRCGGDCEDDGKTFFHKCPRKWPSAAKLASLKLATDRLAVELGRRPWARLISDDHLEELKVAVSEMQAELRQVIEPEFLDVPAFLPPRYDGGLLDGRKI